MSKQTRRKFTSEFKAKVAPTVCSIHYTLLFIISFNVVLLFMPFAMAH